jgi:PAS domain-containing protein
MNDTLPRLLKTYEFLTTALADHGDRLGVVEAKRIKAERSRAFSQIVAYSSGSAQVTMAQLRFILGNLPSLAEDPEMLSTITEIAARHLDAIEADLASAKKPSSRRSTRSRVSGEARFAYFDSLSDRIGIVGRDYRYIFTNASNARFHGESQRSFLDRPNWSVTGERFFERINRPRLDQCFAGHSSTCYCRNPKWASVLQLVTFDPLRDAYGKITAAVILSRDVTDLPVPASMVTTLDAK